MSVFGLISNLFNSNSKKFSRHCSAQTTEDKATTENTNCCVLVVKYATDKSHTF